jgi:hypothetical protein
MSKLAITFAAVALIGSVSACGAPATEPVFGSEGDRSGISSRDREEVFMDSIKSSEVYRAVPEVRDLFRAFGDDKIIEYGRVFCDSLDAGLSVDQIQDLAVAAAVDADADVAAVFLVIQSIISVSAVQDGSLCPEYGEEFTDWLDRN